MGWLDKVKDVGGELLKKKVKTKTIEAGTTLDAIKQQIIGDAAHLAVNGNKPFKRREVLGLIGKRITRLPTKIAGDAVNNLPKKFSYMEPIVTFQNLTGRDYGVAGGIVGAGTLAGAGIGYTHNKLLHKDKDNKEFGHDVLSHGVGEGLLPAATYLMGRKFSN